MNTQNDRRGPSIASIALVAVALVLAFLVGRLTASRGVSLHAEEPQDSEEAVKKVEALFNKFAADKRWEPKEDQEFLAAVASLTKKGQMRQLGNLAVKVNNRELELVLEPPLQAKGEGPKPGAPAQKK